MKVSQNIGEKLVDHFYAGIPLSGSPELDEWVKSSEENKLIYDRYHKIWLGSCEVFMKNKFDARLAWTKVNKKIAGKTVSKQRFNRVLYATIGLAASLLIILSVTFFTNVLSSSGETVKISTNYGSRTSIILPDGSHVKLNVGTNLEYSFDRFNNLREVQFNGEGFFEVAKSKAPFVIHTPEGLNIKVLGTKFNLKAYAEENEIRTTLIEGKVELIKSGSKSLFLEPGQIANYNKKIEKLEYVTGQVYQDIGWVDNKLYMENMSLNEVCKVLERWYAVNIVLENKEMGDNFHYTGVLKEKTISEVLDALCELSDLKYQVKGNYININNKNLKPMRN